LALELGGREPHFTLVLAGEPLLTAASHTAPFHVLLLFLHAANTAHGECRRAFDHALFPMASVPVQVVLSFTRRQHRRHLWAYTVDACNRLLHATCSCAYTLPTLSHPQDSLHQQSVSGIQRHGKHCSGFTTLPHVQVRLAVAVWSTCGLRQCFGQRAVCGICLPGGGLACGPDHAILWQVTSVGGDHSIQCGNLSDSALHSTKACESMEKAARKHLCRTTAGMTERHSSWNALLRISHSSSRRAHWLQANSR
jgi:hypothetical protein